VSTSQASLHSMANWQDATHVLLVEDDAGDALLVETMLEEVGNFHLSWAKSVDEIPLYVEHVDCILLDLGLPGSQGFDALEHALRAAEKKAIVVLTGLDDQSRGAAAVAAGAQDYLVKGRVDGPLLARSILYAVQRYRADENARLLYQAELLRAHNARLERGLLPRPESLYGDLELTTWYRAGADQALVGGDFYDVVAAADGTVRAVIGDVSGHGPDEAALGVALRSAWRALVMAGVDDDAVFPVLNMVIASERHSAEIYATACMVTVGRDRRSISCRVAGHPPPLSIGEVCRTHELERGPALGLIDSARWPATSVAAEFGWTLLLYTDGIIEGHDNHSTERLGVDGLIDAARQLQAEASSSDELLRALVSLAESRNNGPLVDDVAMVLLKHRGRP
jgi:serine phosphatase RsbU (regulator of sigma subunit)